MCALGDIFLYLQDFADMLWRNPLASGQDKSINILGVTKREAKRVSAMSTAAYYFSSLLRQPRMVCDGVPSCPRSKKHQ